MNKLNADIEVTTTGEYADNDEVKIVMYTQQADALAGLLEALNPGDVPMEYRVLVHELSTAIRTARNQRV